MVNEPIRVDLELRRQVSELAARARTMKEEQDRCERLGGHWYFGTRPSQIAHPQEYFEPGWAVRALFSGEIKKIEWAAWKCGRCGQMVSEEEAMAYHARIHEVRKYWLSRLWC
jgi:hypothetical protein